MDVPRATYRLQLGRDFTFAHATELVPYLAALGISHVYLSPCFKARPGSTHGYDIVDHNEFNPEVGDRADFERLCAALREHGMGQMIDVVPNHVGVFGADNAWWRDVLENGRAAEHAGFFDIDWDRLPDELRGKLLLPVLGDRYGAALERGEIALAFDPARGEFCLCYLEHRFPVDPQTYPRVLSGAAERLHARLTLADALPAGELASLVGEFARLPKTSETSAGRTAERRHDKELHKRRLARVCERSAAALRCIEEEMERLNGAPGNPTSFDALDALIGEQPYRLASWRMAADDINYRRFGDVNELAAVRMESPEVFDAAHALLFELIAAREVAALRIDHPDGLHDPAQYFARLQRGAAERLTRKATSVVKRGGLRLYIVVEKITAPFEALPADWPIAGSTGYDFANLVNGLFVDPRAEAKLTRQYSALLGERLDFDEVLYRSKKLIVEVAVASELNALADMLARIAQADRATCDFTRPSLRAALEEVVACLPVYRTYVTAERASADDRRYIEWAVRSARERVPAAEPTAFDFIRDVLTTDLAAARPPQQRAAIVELAMRFQQFAPPVMAKGMEDTAFYVYNRLVSLNEVGGDPRRFGVSVAAFHHANAERTKSWPHAMLTTSTHDSKRAEDVRARIDVLSELPSEWRLHVARWRRINRARRRKLDKLEAPTRNDEYLLYQTLVGAWPDGDMDVAAMSELRERIERHVVKVVREAKAVTSWLNPNEEYEAAFVAFVRGLLSPPGNKRFLADFLPFQRRVAWFGMLNSLAQTLLKLTAPGVPDIYQGCEWWDLSLVDPDNRRPVDFAARKASFEEMQAAAARGDGALASLASELLQKIADGRLKQLVIWRALEARRKHAALFRDGSYVPLPATGEHADHLCAFARVLGDECAIAIAPRLVCTLARGETRMPIGAEPWGDTRISLLSLPQQRAWRNALTTEPIPPAENANALPGALVLHRFPLALLVPQGA